MGTLSYLLSFINEITRKEDMRCVGANYSKVGVKGGVAITLSVVNRYVTYSLIETYNTNVIYGKDEKGKEHVISNSNRVESD